MVTLEYARAYVDEMQRLASRPRPVATESGLRKLLRRTAR